MRISEIDSLRGIAVIFVMLYHYTSFVSTLNDSEFVFHLGFYGVNLFFTISGFVIYMTLSNVKSIKQFLINRVSRIFPAYLGALFVTYGVLLFFSDRNIPFSMFMINLSMMQEFFNVGHVDGVYWTLTRELIFYFFITMTILFRVVKIEVVIIAFMIYTIVIKIITSKFLVESSAYADYLLFLNNYTWYFFQGIALFLLYRDERFDYKRIAIILLSIVLTYGSGHTLSLITNLIFILLFILMYYKKLNLINHVSLRYIGTISYSLYLLHNEIGMIMIYALYPYVDWWSILITCIAMIIISIFFYNYVERPLGKKCKNYLSNNNDNRNIRV